MPRRNQSFSEILSEDWQMPPPASAPPPPPEDMLQLSLQAGKALPPRTGKIARDECAGIHKDCHGNKVAISKTARDMSDGSAGCIAWETRLDR